MGCHGAVYWKKFWAGYGMTDADWADQENVKPSGGKRQFHCLDGSVNAIHRLCCDNKGGCQTRAESQGACCSRSKWGKHHCKRGEE
jgi:hypothetical protein